MFIVILQLLTQCAAFFVGFSFEIAFGLFMFRDTSVLEMINFPVLN